MHKRENNRPKKSWVEINEVYESRMCEVTGRRGVKGKKSCPSRTHMHLTDANVANLL